ncbi:MAG: serine/threonine protein kinase [Pyrinomonadaceae bacterium]|nr:serine/threonine protein kinase [Pyrinomonadaceae bacterium]
MSSATAADQIIDGKYRIEKQLGRGGMGTVFLATHIGTGRPVAVKVISAQFMQNPEFVERFRREAQAAGRLRHPNVVDVTDFGFSVGEDQTKTAYLVMEYLDGCTLGEVLEEEKTLPLDFTIDILEQVCSAVDVAHAQGIIHRDLKPDNIWLEPNQRGGYTVKVLDFGIAKLEEASFAPIVPGDGAELIRDISKTRIVGDGATVADGGDSGTKVDGNSKTMVGEGKTLALDPEGATMVGSDPSEAGTMVQELAEDDPSDTSEAGTVAIPSSSTGSDIDVDPKSTRLASQVKKTDERVERKATADLTRAGAVLGTPLYMSPEQCRGEKLTPSSDIYSLSVIVYQMLSGSLPFSGDYVEVMDGHKNMTPPPLVARKVPKKLKGIVMSSMAKEPEKRPESAEAFSSKLRSNSEGLGVLIRRAIVMYAEYMPKFLLLALICFLPVIILTFLRIGLSFYIASIEGENEGLKQANAAILGIVTFFVQITATAGLIGMTTWTVGRVLAFPLRTVSVRRAIREGLKKWKSLTATVSVSTLIVTLGYSCLVLPGIWLGARFMMIAPSIMMDGVGGRAAFRRSVELYKRSVSTMLAVSALNFLIPVILAISIGFSIGSVIKMFEYRNEISRMKREGVVAQPITEESENKGGVTFSVNQKGGISDKQVIRKPDGTIVKKSMTSNFSQALQEGIFELVWTPIAVLIISFTSVLIGLIYFKLRLAGGESLQNLIGKLEDEEQLQSKWEKRVRERLIQSGKITGGNSQAR